MNNQDFFFGAPIKENCQLCDKVLAIPMNPMVEDRFLAEAGWEKVIMDPYLPPFAKYYCDTCKDHRIK